MAILPMFVKKPDWAVKLVTKVCTDENQVTNRFYHTLDKIGNIGIKKVNERMKETRYLLKLLHNI